MPSSLTPKYAWFPDGQQVDVKNGKMYWSNMGCTGDYATCPHKNGSVYRADWPSGDNVEVVVPTGYIGMGKELHLDTARQQLYCGDKFPTPPVNTSIWRIDLAAGPPFPPPTPILSGAQGAASGVTLDSTGEKILISSDGEGQPPGIGVLSRVMPPGTTHERRTDLVWHYQTEYADHIDADSEGRVYWSDSPGNKVACIRVGSVDGKTPARTIQNQTTVMPPPYGKYDHAIGVAVTRDMQTVYYTTAGVGQFKPGTGLPPGKIFKSSVSGGVQEVVWTAPDIAIDGVAVVEMPDGTP